jgi:hypothetical protein
LIEFPHNDHPDEVFARIRPAHAYANPTDQQYHELVGALHRQWRVATRAVMILLSAGGMTAAEIGAIARQEQLAGELIARSRRFRGEQQWVNLDGLTSARLIAAAE